jgi:hypothetical protein
LDAPEGFDPLKIGRYTVIRVHYEYSGQPPGEKLFVVLKHDNQQGQAFCWCLKATSQTQRYSADAELMAGCVSYEKGELPFFQLDTVIDPSNFITMLHRTLQKEADAGRYRIEGKMPDKFQQEIANAIRNNPVLEPKKKKLLLELIGEKL